MKPIIQRINTFPIYKEQEITFNFYDFQITYVQVEVYDIENNTEMASMSEKTMKNSFTFTMGTSGNYYMRIRCGNNDNVSPWSDKSFFTCIVEPICTFNKRNNETINTSFLDISLSYSNTDELPKEYIFNLYNNFSNKILSSETNYYSANVPISYTFKGLENETDYYVSATIITVNGYQFETEKIHIYVKYSKPSTYSIFYTENEPCKGYIKYSTNFISIQGKTKTTPNFDGDYIDLIKNELEYTEGFNIDGDFLITLVGKEFNLNTNLLIMKNRYDNTITLSCFPYENNSIYFRLTCTDGALINVLYSDIFYNNDVKRITIKRIDNIYSLHVTEL